MLGNCTLLHKTLNCSKKAASMHTFLSRITSINKENWQDSLYIEEPLPCVQPDASLLSPLPRRNRQQGSHKGRKK
jgi:hypothetical protein